MHLTLSHRDALYYLHHAPARDGAPTFVFVNALTGSTEAWEAAVAPALREAGFGTLSWNFRGARGAGRGKGRGAGAAQHPARDRPAHRLG